MIINIYVTLFQYFYKKNFRPKFNDDAPFCYVGLIERCWSHEPEKKKKKDQHLMKLQTSLKQILILLKRMLTRKNFLAMLNSLMKQKNLSIKPKVTENLTKLYQIFMNYMKLKA